MPEDWADAGLGFLDGVAPVKGGPVSQPAEVWHGHIVTGEALPCLPGGQGVGG